MRTAAALTAPDFNPATCAIVSGPPVGAETDMEWGSAHQGAPSFVPVRWKEESPTRVVLDADSGPAPAFLVYSMTAYPGWKARVDGRRWSIRHTDGAFVGLWLPSGSHRIVLDYAPDAFGLGTYLSLVAAAGLMAGSVRAWRYGRHRSVRWSTQGAHQ